MLLEVESVQPLAMLLVTSSVQLWVGRSGLQLVQA
jgi:hypothetical protein